ncbi:hypothetical protein ACLQ3C_05305 [Gordonia sp. DT30]
MTNADSEPVFRALEIVANTLVRAQKVGIGVAPDADVDKQAAARGRRARR